MVATQSVLTKPPDLAFEVDSDSTGRNDYTTKRETYAEFRAERAEARIAELEAKLRRLRGE